MKKNNEVSPPNYDPKPENPSPQENQAIQIANNDTDFISPIDKQISDELNKLQNQINKLSNSEKKDELNDAIENCAVNNTNETGLKPPLAPDMELPEKPILNPAISPRSETPTIFEKQDKDPYNDMSNYSDPLLTPECKRLESEEKDDQVKLIADELLHLMLCELDEDKGINKALNGGDAPEELPSFLTRGIKTDIETICEYLNELFAKIKEDKEGFLDSLATPLNRDPLEILGHLQDIEGDSNGSDSDSIPFQQSVLHVELYLDNEKQRRINRMTDVLQNIPKPHLSN
jgi:hypothetical protein